MDIINKKGIVTMLIGLALFPFKEHHPEPKTNYMIPVKKEKTDGAKHYQKNHKKFKYYIENIGTVFIDNVELSNGKLTALYSYKQGGELRKVVSVLNLDSDGTYKGTCTTKVNGKVLLTVNTWLIFMEDGTASGNWSWSGNPSKNDPIVTISKS